MAIQQADYKNSLPAPPDRARGSFVIRLLAFILALIALPLIGGGAYLIMLGGSVYYLAAGVAFLTSAVLLWRLNGWSVWIAGCAATLTLLWTLAEGGLNIWAMVPRLLVPSCIWLVLLLPFVRRRLSGGPAVRGGRVATFFLLAGLVIAPVSALLLDGSKCCGGASDFVATSAPGTGADWNYFGGTPTAERFSTLDQITPENVSNLRPAWTYDFGSKNPNGLQVTPLKVGSLLYACSSTNVIVALDSDTGRVKWRHDPQVDTSYSPFAACRGVAYYRVPAATGPCATRIYTNTLDARLIALDALTGQRCAGFGRGGEVSLIADMGKFKKGYYSYNSAPNMVRGRIIVGGTIIDNQFWGEPSGVIRAFDAVTGQMSWAYDVGHPDRVGLPPAGQSYTPATPNGWAQMSSDDALGLVYVPMGNATPDYFGGQRRPMDDEISTSVLALDIETGRRRWLFQTVHHDVWDYDLGSQPVLLDIPVNGRMRKALLQPSKRGETFLLDRVTGKPISPMEERPAPQAGSPREERLSPTQPYPTDLPSLAGERLTEARMWGMTPLDQLWCRIRFREARYEGPMTPPGVKPSIQYPGYLGGLDWGGVSVDASRSVMVAVSNHVANYVRLVPRAEADAVNATPMGFGREGLKATTGINAQAGTPYGVETKPFLSPLDVPCQQPPWGRINAVDLKSHKVIWSHPLGSAKESGPKGLRSHLPVTIGVPSLGGTLVTKTGLTFVGASTDRTFRAFDTRTGKLLWQTALPDSGNAAPITYSGGHGRQFVVIAAAGHHGLGTRAGDVLVAFALPK